MFSLARTATIASLHLPPSGLLGSLWKVVSEARDATTVVLPGYAGVFSGESLFYDIESRPMQKNLTDHEKRFYLREIKRDIAYFNRFSAERIYPLTSPTVVSTTHRAGSGTY